MFCKDHILAFLARFFSILKLRITNNKSRTKSNDCNTLSETLIHCQKQKIINYMSMENYRSFYSYCRILNFTFTKKVYFYGTSLQTMHMFLELLFFSLNKIKFIFLFIPWWFSIYPLNCYIHSIISLVQVWKYSRNTYHEHLKYNN